MKMLLMAMVDIEARDSRGGTPLLYAVNSYRDEAVQLLIRSRARVDISDTDSGDTLLHSAVRRREGNIATIVI